MVLYSVLHYMENCDLIFFGFICIYSIVLFFTVFSIFYVSSHVHRSCSSRYFYVLLNCYSVGRTKRTDETNKIK